MPILHLAIAQNHLAICKLILEQIQDIQLLNEWVKLMLHFATLFGHQVKVNLAAISTVQAVHLTHILV
jgi:ankyrin repeat protein